MSDCDGMYEGGKTLYGYPGSVYGDGSHDGIDYIYKTEEEATREATTRVATGFGKQYIFKMELIAIIEPGAPKVTKVKRPTAKAKTVRKSSRGNGRG